MSPDKGWNTNLCNLRKLIKLTGNLSNVRNLTETIPNLTKAGLSVSSSVCSWPFAFYRVCGTLHAFMLCEYHPKKLWACTKRSFEFFRRWLCKTSSCASWDFVCQVAQVDRSMRFISGCLGRYCTLLVKKRTLNATSSFICKPWDFLRVNACRTRWFLDNAPLRMQMLRELGFSISSCASWPIYEVDKNIKFDLKTEECLKPALKSTSLQGNVEVLRMKYFLFQLEW